MDFSKALNEIKAGKKIQRSGWNGKNMYLTLQRGYPEGIAINKNTSEATGIIEGTKCFFLPYIMMKTINENEFVPWLASQIDILAEDWQTI